MSNLDLIILLGMSFLFGYLVAQHYKAPRVVVNVVKSNDDLDLEQ